MKKVLVIISCILTTLQAGATKNPELINELKNNVIVDLSRIELQEDHSDFVEVSFIIVNGQIKLRTIDSSSIELEDLIVKELSGMKIKSSYEADVTYRYRFTFKKI